MKLGRFQIAGKIFSGQLEEETVFPIKDLFDKITPVGSGIPLAETRVLAPCQPGKVICVGLNYRDHAEEFGLKIPQEPIIFLKPASAVIGPGDTILCPSMSQQVDYEAELAVIIKKKARLVAPEKAENYILGYTCANDVTARDLQQKDGQWTRAKSFDTFLPLGPYITTGLDPHELNVYLYLNGQCKQKSNTEHLIFDVYHLVSFISQIMTLEPGDVILTGTPAGVGAMKPGDKVEVKIEGIGNLTNVVAG